MTGRTGRWRRLRRVRWRLRHWLIWLMRLCLPLCVVEVGHVGLLPPDLVEGTFFRREELHERNLLVGVLVSSVPADIPQLDNMVGVALEEKRRLCSRFALPPPPDVAVVGFVDCVKLCNREAETSANAVLEAEAEGGDMKTAISVSE